MIRRLFPPKQTEGGSEGGDNSACLIPKRPWIWRDDLNFEEFQLVGFNFEVYMAEDDVGTGKKRLLTY